MIPFYIVVLPVVFLFCGLSIDVGMLELKKIQMQSAADAAAISAELEAERGTENWVNVGIQDAGVNGYTNGSNNVTVTVAQKPSTGTYAGRYDAIQATITQTVNTTFMGALNGGKATIGATASALITPCAYFLGTGTLMPYSFNGYTGDFKGDSCPVDVNTSIMTQSTSLAPEATNVAGPASASSVQGYIWPGITYNVPAITDPLAYVTSPTFSGTCNHTSYSLYNVSSNTTLYPGTYCKGLNITNSTATLSPGLYVITGGGTWYNSTVTGSGVTLYFTTGGGATDGKFILSQSTVTISAPNAASSGSLAGILVFADRSWSTTNAQDFDIINSTFTGDGIWYIPKAGLYVQNSNSVTAPHYLGIVADNISLTGTDFQISNNYTNLTGGNPFRTLATLAQ